MLRLRARARLTAAFILAFWLAAASFQWPALAATTPPAEPSWQQLTAQQRAALAPLQTEWDRFGIDRKRKWLDIAARYPLMSAEQQATLHRRMGDWVRMTPQQRMAARENYLATGKAPTAARRQAWENYQKLPDAKKRELARQAKAPPATPARLRQYGTSTRNRRPKPVASAAARPSVPSHPAASAAAAVPATAPAAPASTPPAQP